MLGNIQCQPFIPALPFLHLPEYRNQQHTFGKLTFGMMTLPIALGASFGGFFGSPPG
jgi:hypothetical protein